MDRGAWQATLLGVAKSDTTEQLTHTHTHTQTFWVFPCGEGVTISI